MSDFQPTKTPYLKVGYTSEQAVELIRCQEDPIYFIENFIKVQHPVKGMIPLKLYPFQIEMIKAYVEHRKVVSLCSRQMGKALDLDTPILTPEGFKTMRDIRKGDTIYGPDGKPAEVTFITDEMFGRPCYNVEFAHGETIVADAEHEWTVNVYKNNRIESVTKTTVELVNMLDRAKSSGQAISIDHCQPVDFETKEPVIDPYVFGMWLGDGDKNCGRITCHVDDYSHYAARASQAGFKVSDFHPDKRRPTTGSFNVHGLNTRLNELGFRGNKHIPTDMVFTSFENRIELLRGLMDTDGTVEKNGVSRFYQSNEALAKMVRLLLSTLGIKSTLRIKKTTHRDCFIVTFATTQPVCSLPRKSERLTALKQHPKNERIYFKSISPTKSRPVRCLEVANEAHLFLCGYTLIPTHNTACAAAFLLWYAMFHDDQTILIAANVYRQAQEIMHRIRTAYEECPDHIRAGAVAYNKGSITFDNGSRIVSQATTANTGRGMSISLLYCDELAHAPPKLVEAMFTSLAPTLSTGGKAIITSTPLTDVDTFAQIWRGAKDNKDEYGNEMDTNGEGRNGYFPFEAIWSDHPDRDENWASTERAGMSEAKWLQEHCNEFVSDEQTLIASLTFKEMKVMHPAFYTEQVRWYREPEPNRSYLVALDPSGGTGGDFAAIEVFMLPEMEQIAEWQNNRTVARGQVKVLMKILHTLDGELREHPDQHGDPDIFWTVENNSIGEAVLQVIEDTGEDRFPGQIVNEKKRRGQSRRFRKGLNTDNRKKLSACSRLKSLVESGRMKVNSNNLLTEMKNFVATGASYSAKPGTTDDLVSATLLITRMLDVVIDWTAGAEALKEYIGDDELYGFDEDGAAPLPTM